MFLSNILFVTTIYRYSISFWLNHGQLESVYINQIWLQKEHLSSHQMTRWKECQSNFQIARWKKWWSKIQIVRCRPLLETSTTPLTHSQLQVTIKQILGENFHFNETYLTLSILARHLSLLEEECGKVNLVQDDIQVCIHACKKRVPGSCLIMFRVCWIQLTITRIIFNGWLVGSFDEN